MFILQSVTAQLVFCPNVSFLGVVEQNFDDNDKSVRFIISLFKLIIIFLICLNSSVPTSTTAITVFALA